MALLIKGDSLARNSLGGLNNSFHFPPQALNRGILLNEPLFHDGATYNEWRGGGSLPLVNPSYPLWQTMLPITRLQQLSIRTKHLNAEIGKSLQGIYPMLLPNPNFSNPLDFGASTNIPKHGIGQKNNHTNQRFVLPHDLQGNGRLSKNSVEKSGDQWQRKSAIKHVNNLELSIQKPNGSSKGRIEARKASSSVPSKTDSRKQASSSHEGDSNKNKPPQKITDLRTRKRSSSWPIDIQLNKRCKRNQGARFDQSYKNLEMDVANILVSDIPIAVVGLNAPKENTNMSLLPGVDSESDGKHHSTDSAGDVDSDNSSQSDRESTRNNRAKQGMVAFTCQQCAVTCQTTEDLISHNASHTTNNFTFKCNVCYQVFRSTNGLQKHVEFHADDEHQYHCSFCFQPFGNKTGLEEHIINTHMSKRPHKCTYCPKAFRDPGSLQKHVRVHTGEKPYQCKACEKSFAEYSSLRKHLRVHTGEQPYKCKFCPKAFSISGNLQRHILIHTGERPYKCSDCSKAFNNPSHLRRHIKNLHSKLENQK